MTRDDILNNFRFHPVKGNQGERYEAMRAKIRDTALYIYDNTPESREQTLALRELEKAMFYANAAIARNE